MYLPHISRPSTHSENSVQVNSGLRNLQFPQISRIISRISHSFDVNFFEKELPRILIILVIGTAFLSFFGNQDGREVNRIDVLENVLLHSPSDFNKRLQLALLYEREFTKTGNLQNLDRALAEARFANQFDPSNSKTLRLLARLNRADESEIRKEIAAVEKIVAARPDYSAAWQKLAVLYEKLGDTERAAIARSRAKLLNGNF